MRVDWEGAPSWQGRIREGNGVAGGAQAVTTWRGAAYECVVSGDKIIGWKGLY